MAGNWEACTYVYCEGNDNFFMWKECIKFTGDCRWNAKKWIEIFHLFNIDNPRIIVLYGLRQMIYLKLNEIHDSGNTHHAVKYLLKQDDETTFGWIIPILQLVHSLHLIIMDYILTLKSGYSIHTTYHLFQWDDDHYI